MLRSMRLVKLKETNIPTNIQIYQLNIISLKFLTGGRQTSWLDKDIFSWWKMFLIIPSAWLVMRKNVVITS